MADFLEIVFQYKRPADEVCGWFENGDTYWTTNPKELEGADEVSLGVRVEGDLQELAWARQGSTREEASRCLLPPSIVTQSGSQFHGIWLVRPPFIRVVRFWSIRLPQAVIAYTPGLVYSARDVVIAHLADDDLLDSVVSPEPLRGRARVRHDLQVVKKLRELGLSDDAIAEIGKRQPVGRYYRGKGAAGTDSAADHMCADLLEAYAEAGNPADGLTAPFVARRDPDLDVLWFYMPSVLEWWDWRYGLNMEVTHRAMRRMLSERRITEVNQSGRYILRCRPMRAGGKLWRMDGIDLQRFPQRQPASPAAP